MQWWLAAMAAAVAVVLVASAEPEEPRPLDTDHLLPALRLVWCDEFDGDKLDLDRWQYRTGKRLLGLNKPENVTVGDGHLRIALRKEAADGLDYTAGGVISRRLFSYGYFEAALRCPPGAGWHTSFWTMYFNGGDVADAHHQEIDICEQDSVKLDRYSAGVIDWSVKPQRNFGRQTVSQRPDLARDFHVFGCEFTPQRVRFLFDGKLTHETPATAFPHARANVWLTSIPAPWGRTPPVDDRQLPALAEFDWVRVYEPAAPWGRGAR